MYYLEQPTSIFGIPVFNYACFNYIFLTCILLYNVIAPSHVQNGVEAQKALETYNRNANAPS